MENCFAVAHPAHLPVMLRPCFDLVEGKSARESLAIALLMPALTWKVANTFYSNKHPYYLYRQEGCIHSGQKISATGNWRARWKNRISSTSMKLRKSLVKPVMRQNISSCSVLSPEIVMHDAFYMLFSERPPIYASSCMTISGERTKQHVVIGFGELAAVD